MGSAAPDHPLEKKASAAKHAKEVRMLNLVMGTHSLF